ncbi:MAG TPA: hypothetical protein EYG70_02105 [Sulfurimonas sp.]|nr:hypothetical protein [Sulfurimonas sp.]
MFIVDVIKKEDAAGELKLVYKIIERSLGFIPPHFELFATLDLESMKEFMAYNQKIVLEENISKFFLAKLRLEIANRECRKYCIAFNTKIVQKNSHEVLSHKQELLLKKVLKAIYETEIFDTQDISDLKKEGIDEKNHYTLLSYAANFISKSKLIEVYLKKAV